MIHERSPYLQQHAHNPVDWYPWGDEAFEKARAEDKPVFLSIGYATCHWCHVMERESFENQEIAELLNNAFVCIKVDREERPDIDDIYMTVCQMMTRSGGWPLTICMTPHRRPFYAATYIPAETRFGRPGMTELIPQLSNAWKNRRADVLQSADQVTEALSGITGGSASGALDEALLDRAWKDTTSEIDTVYGGFGGHPKFPTTHRLVFLMRQDPAAAKETVLSTLRAMHCGGIWDHVGFGIHRYSTDRQWLVPHFEKMLYDQALLVLACTEAFEAYGDPTARRMAEQTIEYVLRDMTAPGGGFYSAEDADSEGEEGRFYVWTLEELREVLDENEYSAVVSLSGCAREGNFHDESTGAKTGKNIIHLSIDDPPRPAATPPVEGNRKSSEKNPLHGGVREAGGGFFRSSKTELPDAIRKKLFAAREQRIHPLKDTKVLADWNGLMIAALAKAGRVFEAPDYTAAAQRAADFILSEMSDGTRLQHRWREGHTAVPGMLDDYAFIIFGLLELYETTLHFQWLEKSAALNETVLENFQCLEAGGFYMTAADAEKLIVRPKSSNDGALPAGNFMQMLNLLKLARLTGRTEYETLAEQTGQTFAEHLNRVPHAFPQALQALQFAFEETVEIVIVGDPESVETVELIRAVRSVYRPQKTVLFKTPDDPDVEKIAPFTQSMRQPAVYLCRDFSCEAPLTDADKVREALR
ncbi:MAG TPA: thioredoxin domain-containing protein [Tichowtungia sp.]|nr:thioredoxin domain-containing protein [Tichowtungia sp.]